MTDQDINIAIAECCGWEQREHEEMQMHWPGGMRPTKTMRWFFGKSLFTDAHRDPPNYVEDLNACHEMEMVLTPDEELLYFEWLGGFIMSQAYENDPRYLKSHLSSSDSTYRATGRQRCEAFLRVKWLWK